MRIEQINITSFGMLVSRTFEFGCGINLVEGENESGKSTLAAFIKFMLYGLDKKAGADKLSERQRYINWQTGEASGSMILVCDGKRYKIERCVRLTSRSESGRENFRESCSVIDTENGMKVAEGEVPGEVFLGISREVYENTAYIKQLGISGVDASLIGEAIQNILFSADESINTQRACDKLDLSRRAILHKNEHGGKLYDLMLEKSNEEMLLARAKDENSAIIAKEGERAEDIERIEECKARLKTLKDQKEAHDILELLHRFESMHALDEKLKKTEHDFEIYAKVKGYEGFLPDREYVRELTEAERAIIEKRASLLSRQSALAELKNKSAYDPSLSDIFAEIREAGGKEAVLSEHDALAAAKKNMGIFGTVFAVLGGLCLVFGALVLAVFSALASLGFVLLGAGVVLVSAAIGAFFSKKNKSKSLCALLSRFGVREGETLAELVARANRNEEAGLEFRTVLSACENEIEEINAEIEALCASLTKKAAKWGKDGKDIHAVIAEALSVSEKADAMKLETEKYRTPAESAKRELAAYNEKELKKRFSALGVEGADTLSTTALVREIEFTQNKIESLNYRKIETEKQLIALGATARDPVAIAAKLNRIEKEAVSLAKKHAAYKLAIESIETASENLRAGVTPRLSESARAIMSSLTGGKYFEGGYAHGDGEFLVSFVSDGEHRRLEMLSAGTRDAAYISLRIALAELLSKKSSPALILDESSCYLDDARTKNLLTLLDASGAQSIIFSCRKREKELLSGKEFNYIRL